MPESHTGLYAREIAEHPAARAWTRIGGGLSGLRAVIPVARRQVSLRKSSAYRLSGVGEDGASVIAKKCPLRYGLLERTIYERVLTNIPLPHPQFYGMASDDDEISCWLFIEDVGNQEYSLHAPTHRTIAGRWLGILHPSTTSLPSDLPLPDRGHAYYLGHLRSALANIRDNLNNPALNDKQRRHLKEIASRCEFVEDGWHHIERFCAEIPQTLVHGDFVGKNVRVRNGPSGAELLPFDWEHAGRGVPAVDIAQAVFPATDFLANPDLEAYWGAVQRPRLRFDAVLRLATYGTVFRCLAALHWESARLAYEWVEWPVKNMILYEAELAHAVQAAGWRQ